MMMMISNSLVPNRYTGGKFVFNAASTDEILGHLKG
jgi:hypothetical protein